MNDSDSKAKGFKVTDRRKFTDKGELRSPEEEQHVWEQKPSFESRSETTATESSGPGIGQPPEVGFMDLLSWLTSSALAQLGEIPDPVSGERVENLPGVQVVISLLSVLKDKTKGNLSEVESKAVDGVLYDLRVRFMAKANLIKR